MDSEGIKAVQKNIFCATLCLMVLILVFSVMTWKRLSEINVKIENITTNLNAISEPKVVYVVAETRGNMHPASFREMNKQLVSEMKKAGYINVTVMPQPFENDDLVMVSFEQPTLTK